MSRSRSILLGAAAVAALFITACSDDDQEDLGNAVDTIVDEAEEAGRTAISAAGDAAGAATSDAAELAVRNVATQQGEESFAEAGHALDDAGLTCEATVTDGAAQVDVSCTGTTEDGGAAALTGQTTEMPGASVTELEGQFAGTVDGTEVFSGTGLGS